MDFQVLEVFIIVSELLLPTPIQIPKENDIVGTSGVTKVDMHQQPIMTNHDHIVHKIHLLVTIKPFGVPRTIPRLSDCKPNISFIKPMHPRMCELIVPRQHHSLVLGQSISPSRPQPMQLAIKKASLHNEDLDQFQYRVVQEHIIVLHVELPKHGKVIK